MVTTTEDADAAVAALAASGVSSSAARARDSVSTRPLANAAAAPRTPRESPRGSSRVVADASSPLVARRNAAVAPRNAADGRVLAGVRNAPQEDGVSGGSSRNAGGPGTGTAADGNHGDGDHGDGDEAPGDGASGDDEDRGDGNHGDGYDAPGAHEEPGARERQGGLHPAVRASSSLAGPLGANARDSAGVGREPARR